MSKKINLPLVVLLAGTIAACDTTAESSGDKPSQRDVYTSVEACIADWGDTDLCEKSMADAKEAAAAKIAQAGNGGGGVAFVPIFLGPSYTPGERYTNYNGQRVVPNTQRSVATSTFVRTPTGAVSRPSFKPPAPVTSPSAVSNSASRGGFGATGAARSGGSVGS